MTWSEITSREAVLRAMKDFDERGREAFLKHYGFGRAARYVVEHEESSYDAKALLGAAHGFQFPERGPLQSSDIPSSERAVRGTLTKLGFTVQANR